MELIAEKNSKHSERYNELLKVFYQIDGDIREDAKKNKLLNRQTDLESYFIRLKYLGETIKQIYKENDYEASMLCCKYLMPRIVKFIDYIYELLRRSNASRKPNEALLEWIYKEDDLTKYTRRGQPQSVGRLGYVYDVMRWEYMAIAARYSVHWCITYMERDKLKKAYTIREKVLESYVHYANSMLLGRIGKKWLDEEVVPNTIIFSTMPSSGKSFVNNVLNLMGAILGALYLSIGGILRVGNEQGNIFRQSSQTKNMLENPLILDIYPELKELIRANGKYDPYGKSSEEEWSIRENRQEPTTCVFKTRDSALNSVRCYMLAIMDDPSRGQEEATNIPAHQSITAKYNGDFKDRFDNQDDMAICLTGTMYNPYDVFSTEIQKTIAKGVYQDKKFKNTLISNDKKTVIIVNDCEDEYGNSAYPEFISSEALAEKRESLDAYTYACVWRNHPIPAEGLLFDDTLLKHYITLPRKDDGSSLLTEYSFAYLDPTRKTNSDFLSMPIGRRNLETGEHYLVDVIFNRKSSRDCYDKIVDKIEEHKIVKLRIECNTSEDLSEVIKGKLKERGIKYCTIDTIYNTVNKNQRIADMAGTIKENIVFPEKAKFNPKTTEMGNFLNWLSQYSNVALTKYDDAPDSLAGYVKAYIIDNKDTKNIVKAYKSLPF